MVLTDEESWEEVDNGSRRDGRITKCMTRDNAQASSQKRYEKGDHDAAKIISGRHKQTHAKLTQEHPS